MSMKAETKKQFEQEEQAYWRQRNELLKRYRDKWVAVVGGQVVATGDHSGEVIREAHQKTGSKVGCVAHVSHEDEVQRIRQVAAGYYDHSLKLHPPGGAAMSPKIEELARQIVTLQPVEQEELLEKVADLNFQRGLETLSQRYRERLAAAGKLHQKTEEVMAELARIHEEIALREYQ